MAKKYKKGDDYLIYLDTADSFGTPTWALIKAATDPKFDPAKADVVVPEAGSSDGHLQGFGDPLISFTLLEDAGDANVTAILDAAEDGTMKHIAVANGPIATTGTVYRHMEVCITAAPLSAGRGEPASWAVEVRRHANSDNDITKTTVA
jgi:hypothetical protein